MHAREPSKSHLGQDVFDNLDTYLDFEMILEDLRKMGDDEMFRKQAFVLQALRMRLTHAPNLAEKRRILRMYLDNDVLGVISGQDVIIPLLQTGPHIVCEQMARFLNTMTSECIGRDYILAGEEAGITAALVTALVNETRDSLYQQNLLGTLQKLSLRRSAQSTMNKMNVLEFLHKLLEHSDSLSDYSCEYGTALFMNLCLRTAGRKQCLQNPVRTLETLLGLLEIDSMQIQTYVNGALYSILSEPAFRECATSLRLNESLLFLQKSANDQVKGQINFVLEQLYSTDQQHDDAVSEDGADEDEEEDEEDQEPEEDFDQLIPSFPNDKAGTDVLLTYCTDTPHRSVSRSVKRNGTGGLAGSGEEPLVRKSTTAIPNQAARELRRPKTPTMRSITPAPVKVQHSGASWPKETNVNASGSKGENVKPAAPKRQANVPTTETE
ncbi:LisH domain-containing protein armc9 [Rhizoclosmatium hyalinum]|nr:LisH domain-containing protein armc9 [Rhizoclosmatium hyalinum]